MPRRRTTRASSATSKRPAPSMPEGDEGKDMDAEKRREKVLTLIRDFKNEVDSRTRNLRASVNEMLNQVDLAYTMEMMNIPQKVRQMPLTEYLKSGGSFEEAEVGQVLHENLISILDEGVLKKNKLGTISESDINEITSTNKRGGRRKKNSAVTNGPPPTTRRLRKGTDITTPSSNYSLIGATPLITPKFDPRLYQTPAVPKRDPLPGEILMSMEGSPIINPVQEKPTGTIGFPLNDNKTVFYPGDLHKVDIGEVDPGTLRQTIQSLQQMEAKLNAVKNFPAVTKK